MPTETRDMYALEQSAFAHSSAIVTDRIFRRATDAGLGDRLEEGSLTAGRESRIDADDPNGTIAAIRGLVLADDCGHSERLVSLLHHADPRVADAAEHALWRLWFGSGPAAVQSDLYRAMLHLQAERWPEALADLDAVVAVEPGHAEAWNQRAIAHYFVGDYCGSISDCKRVLALNPYHFGAMAGMGHCFAQLGRFEDALDCYHRALQIHPRMEGIRQTIREIRSLMRPSQLAGC